MKVVLLGSPGVGKGTYAQILTKMYDMPSISTGELLRTNVKQGTEVGLKANEYMERGDLVPDEIVICMLQERITDESGFFLDGFPRTIGQAEKLSTFAKIDVVLNFVAPDEVIIDRLSGRRQCKKCSTIFHVKNVPPKVEGICDKCGGELYQRKDDTPESIKERLDIYRQKTKPLINYYTEKGILAKIDATKNIDIGKDEIIGACEQALNKFKGD